MFIVCSKDETFFEEVRMDVEDEAGRFGVLQHLYVEASPPVCYRCTFCFVANV